MNQLVRSLEIEDLTILPMTPTIGAEVEGIDLSRPLDVRTVSALRRALLDWKVLFFRDQDITTEQHLAFARNFGDLEVHPFAPQKPGYPEVLAITHDANSRGKENTWHSDVTWRLEPSLGSILRALEIPPVGGDTLFADMYAAFDTLDEDLKAQVRGLRAVHGSDHVFGEKGVYANTDQPELAKGGVETPETVHPVVIKHPGSGKPVLYVNPSFTLRFEGMTREESMPLLMKLYAHAMNTAHVHTLVREPGTVAIWDNRATWHFAKNDYHGHYRLMHRITLAGCELEAA
jgi:taurine dioxygenase